MQPLQDGEDGWLTHHSTVTELKHSEVQCVSPPQPSPGPPGSTGVLLVTRPCQPGRNWSLSLGPEVVLWRGSRGHCACASLTHLCVLSVRLSTYLPVWITQTVVCCRPSNLPPKDRCKVDSSQLRHEEGAGHSADWPLDRARHSNLAELYSVHRPSSVRRVSCPKQGHGYGGLGCRTGQSRCRCPWAAST